jgi:hypothetical protein
MKSITAFLKPFSFLAAEESCFRSASSDGVVIAEVHERMAYLLHELRCASGFAFQFPRLVAVHPKQLVLYQIDK